MDMMGANVVCGLLASIIFDICKNFYEKLSERKKVTKETIYTEVKKALQKPYADLFDSASFEAFINSTTFKDIIGHFVRYKISGRYNDEIAFDSFVSSLTNETRRTTGVSEDEVIKYLTDAVLDYYSDDTLYVPKRDEVKKFFKDFFRFVFRFITSNTDDKDKTNLFLINQRLDYSFGALEDQIIEIEYLLKRTMKCDSVIYNEKYQEAIAEYHKILKNNNSQAHIYLLDTFDFKDFYVPPFLTKQERIMNYRNSSKVRTEGLEELLYQNLLNEQLDDADEKRKFDDWKYIFESSNIVYVTGGAGYGKSLFLKNIINNYDQLKILSSTEYLVIYGDLKSFYSDDETPISMVKYLQKCMIKETLLDENYLTTDMIEHYIKSGRCLILLDALDEVEKQKRIELHKTIISYFKAQNPNNKICITSRDRAFIPAKDILVYQIQPLKRIQIEKYVDNIIKLKKFDKKDKEKFLEQSNIMLNKGFLNSFLVLSLLINIYKSERELPETKIELYQKCFDYIACKREKEKTKIKVKWDTISCMMKDSTFVELSRMCYPNNKEIGKNEIVNMLCETYNKKYACLLDTENAAEQFLAFCSDRTELFVPASGEDNYKFFHRSFFEFFYSQYIFTRISSVEKEYELFMQFDVDSEVFELTMATFKQKDEMRYQSLMEHIFSIVDKELNRTNPLFYAFNILTLVMQVVDDNEYINRYFSILIDKRDIFINTLGNLPNQQIIGEIILNNSQNAENVLEAYKEIAEYYIVKAFLLEIHDARRFKDRRTEMNNSDVLISEESSVFNPRYENAFFVKVFNLRDVLDGMKDYDFSKMINAYEKKSTLRKALKNDYNFYIKREPKEKSELITLFLGELMFIDRLIKMVDCFGD